MMAPYPSFYCGQFKLWHVANRAEMGEDPAGKCEISCSGPLDLEKSAGGGTGSGGASARARGVSRARGQVDDGRHTHTTDTTERKQNHNYYGEGTTKVRWKQAQTT